MSVLCPIQVSAVMMWYEFLVFVHVRAVRPVYIDRFDTLDEVLINALQASCNVWAPGIEIIAVRCVLLVHTLGLSSGAHFPTPPQPLSSHFFHMNLV